MLQIETEMFQAALQFCLVSRGVVFFTPVNRGSAQRGCAFILFRRSVIAC
jgi:hypothetical protein